MGGNTLRIEPNKIDEAFTFDPLVTHYCKESGIWGFMECMKGGHDEKLSK